MWITEKIKAGYYNTKDYTLDFIERHPALSGAVAGGTVGSVVPIVGTITGMIAGATVGHYIGKDGETK
jgi:phage tail tape-measure protein